LGETTEYDTVGGYAGFDFGFDEAVEVIAGFEDAGFILACLKVAKVGLGGRLVGS
jgi:hypothetical protein